MSQKLAHIITAIFNPLILPTLAFIVLLNLPIYISLVIPPVSRWLIIGIVFFVSFVFPLIFFLILHLRGSLSTIYMYNRNERTIPFVIAIVFFYLAYYMIRKLQIAPIFHLFLGGATLLLVINLLINFLWKISSHMIGVGALVGGIIALSFFMSINFYILLPVTVLISGLTGWARLKLNAHTPAQVYAGFMLGAVVIFSLLTWYST